MTTADQFAAFRAQIAGLATCREPSPRRVVVGPWGGIAFTLRLPCVLTFGHDEDHQTIGGRTLAAMKRSERWALLACLGVILAGVGAAMAAWTWEDA